MARSQLLPPCNPPHRARCEREFSGTSFSSVENPNLRYRERHAGSMKESFACIDPALPLCWEDPQTLRLGFDRAEARIAQPSAGTQRLLAVLQRGLPLSELPRASLLVGATASERCALIELVASVLVTRPIEVFSGSTRVTSRGGSSGVRREKSEVGTAPVDARRLRIAVLGRGGAAESLHSAVARAGWESLDWPELPSDVLGVGHTAPDLCIVVERFMEPPATFHALAASGVPHLAVRFTDRSVRIGPLVIPGLAPCISCLHLSEVALDPGLPALAAQLHGRFPAAETPESAEFASALAMAYVHRWRNESDWQRGAQLRLRVEGGMPSTIPEEHSVLAHPDCACATASAAPWHVEASTLSPPG